MPIRTDEAGNVVGGYDVIYPPRGEAGEYSPLALNLYKGCGHACAYCYVPLVTKQPRAEFNAGAVPRSATSGSNGMKSIIERLLLDARKFRIAGITTQVMMSFTTDPYHPGDTYLTRRAIEVLIDHGLAFCTLTKGANRALRDLDLFRPDRDAFASTLTTLDDAFSLKWEPKAALPAERLHALRKFHDAGIFTWVSLEPTLDVEASLEIVRETHTFVDLYKVGQANYLKEITRTTDWRDYTLRMIELLQKVGARHYIKEKLQEHLPAFYSNPLRVEQHH